MKRKSEVKLSDVLDRNRGKFDLGKRGISGSFMTKSTSGRHSVGSWLKECASFFNKLQGRLRTWPGSFTIHWIGFASMIKIARTSVHVDFNEQNGRLILIRDYLI